MTLLCVHNMPSQCIMALLCVHNMPSQCIMALLCVHNIPSQCILALLCVQNMPSQCIMVLLWASFIMFTTPIYDNAVSPVNSLNLLIKHWNQHQINIVAWPKTRTSSWWSSVRIMWIVFDRDISLVLHTREISLHKNNSHDLHRVITHSHVLVIICMIPWVIRSLICIIDIGNWLLVVECGQYLIRNGSQHIFGSDWT